MRRNLHKHMQQCQVGYFHYIELAQNLMPNAFKIYVLFVVEYFTID